MLTFFSFPEFYKYLEELEIWQKDRLLHKGEVARLQNELIKSQTEVTKLGDKLRNAQHLLTVEKEKRQYYENQVLLQTVYN